jgi:hypothetical protein
VNANSEERKLVYLDSANQPRALRGKVTIEGNFVHVRRLDGELIVPASRVVTIEGWEGSRS